MYADMSSYCSSMLLHIFDLHSFTIPFFFTAEEKAPSFFLLSMNKRWVPSSQKRNYEGPSSCFSRQKIKVLNKNVNVCGRNLLVCTLFENHLKVSFHKIDLPFDLFTITNCTHCSKLHALNMFR